MRLILLAFVAGCWVLQQQAALPPAWWREWVGPAALLACGGACLIGLRWRRDRSAGARRGAFALATAFSMAAGGVSGALWAAWRAEARLADWLASEREGADIALTGVVSGLPTAVTGGARFAFALDDAATNADDARGRLPARVLLHWQGAPPALSPGERYTLVVRLRRPRGLANPHGFDYAYWLLQEGYGATGYVRALRDGPHAPARMRFAWRIERWRATLRDRIRAALPPGARFAPVLVALVVGDQRGIDAGDWQVFNRTGIGHLISISGLHITMIAGLAGAMAHGLWRHSFGLGHWLRRPLPLWRPARHVALVAAVLTAIGYGLVAGMQIPALRTVAMLAVAALATWSGRAPPPSLVLGWAAFVALAIDPWAVLSAGFWLSFGAVGVIFLAARPQAEPSEAADAAPGPWQRSRRVLADAARTQWAVTIGLVPLTLLLFRQVSVVSPLANAVAIPVVSLLVTPLALAGAVAPLAVAEWLLGVAHWLIAWLADLLRWMAAPPWAVWQAAWPGPLALLLAAAGVVILLLPAAFGLRPRIHGVLLMLPMLAAGRQPVARGEFRVMALDVGQGSAVVIETRSHVLLYDAGPGYPSGASAGAQVVVPYLRVAGVHRLQQMMISHEDADHAGGAADVSAAVPADEFLTGSLLDHPLLASAGNDAAGRWQPCVAGQQWEWDGVRFAVLHPPAVWVGDAGVPSNARSCVLRVGTAHRTLLLTGDIRAEDERRLAQPDADALRADFLLVPHHGSGTSSSLDLLRAVRPEVAVFQLGYGNRYRHPRPDVWKRYAREGVHRYRTDETGAVSIATKGEGYEILPYRQRERRYWRDSPPAPR